MAQSTANAKGFFARIDAVFSELARARTTAHEFETLAHLSDAQLKERGLTRSQIVRHAARAYL